MVRPRTARAVCVLLAASTGMLAAGPDHRPAPLHSPAHSLPALTAHIPAHLGLLPSVREKRITINRKTYIVSVWFQRLLVTTFEDDIVGGNTAEHIQTYVNIQTADGSLIDPISTPTLTVRAPWRGINVPLSPSAQGGILPYSSMSWSGFVGRTLNDETPNVSLSFRSRGRTYSVALNDVPINGVGGSFNQPGL